MTENNDQQEAELVKEAAAKAVEEKAAAAKAAEDLEQEKRHAQGEKQEKISFPAMEKAEELLKKLEEKEKQLLERELKLDAKLKEIDKAAAEAKISGFGQMRAEKSEEEKAIEAANKLVQGTGLDPFPDLNKKQ